ncbi:MAG: VCBS repeat-containing protein [candidate division Zixibacteria bacterium]|nr:VCBS repeat-containing protein [candidate division Zixibacteria bacterium]
MNHCYKILIATILIVLPAQVLAHDPGETDTLRFEAGPIGVGMSEPLVISIYNDSAIVSWDAYLLFTSSDSSLLAYDSVRYVGRLADPSVEPVRIVTPKFGDSMSPDSLIIACLMGIGNSLPPGDGPVMELYFTGLKLGTVTIDTLLGGIDFTHPGYHPSGEASEYLPYYEPLDLDVVQPNRPPEIEVLTELPIVATTRDRIVVELSVSVFTDAPLVVELYSLASTDDSTIVPSSKPEIHSGDPCRFTWRPGYNDVGIWKAIVSATDSTGLTSLIDFEIQIVASEDYLLPLFRTETRGVLQATGLAHGNLDNDPYPELLVSAHPSAYSPSFGSYDFLSDGRLDAISIVTDDQFTRGLVVAYLNDDPHLDAVVCFFNHPRVYAGQGDGGFVVNDDQPTLIPGVRSAVLTDYDGDARLDYVVTGYDNLQIFRQGDGMRFEPPVLVAIDDTALTVTSADLNLDGWDDLAVGTRAGLDIYLNDGLGNYNRGEHYEQTFGTTDIEVTNHGSDFNGDGLFDLCLATPSVGGIQSELMIYLGNGDGTFEPKLVRRVRGQVFANRPGDFNGDSYLDIAYINGAERYLAIIFGDGHGEFPNELRYRVPDISPRQLDAVDFDLDGDLDLIVAAYNMSTVINSGYFVYVNPLDPSSVNPAQLEVHVSNNASVELRAPSGGRLSRVVNSIASGEMHLRKLDTNAVIDEVVVSGTVENGRYDLLIRPRPNLPAGEPFSLSYQVDNRQFRLVDNQLADLDGFIFPIYPAGSSPISPIQGDFIQTAMPTFTWPSAGVERFELATDLGFGNILESATVGNGVYTLSVVLPDTDSATYYWRARTETVPDASLIYTFNVVHSPPDVDDPDSPDILPDSCRLAQNFPNPFNPETTIEFYLPTTASVAITIHNVLGQLIKTLVHGSLPAGTHMVDWDATDLNDRPVASGIYFYRMEMGEFSSTRKMALVR